jgi:hypothetical protein
MPGVGSRTAVQRAVDEFDVTTFQLDIQPAARYAARQSLDRSGLLLLGGVHGVRQNALAVRALMAALDVTGLALDWPAGLAQPLSEFFLDGQVPDHPLLWGGDGRITVGDFALLRERFNAGRLAALTLFEGVDADVWWRREAVMADRVLAATEHSATGRTLVVAGNEHTRLTLTGRGLPLGARLADRRPGLREIRIRYGNGSYFDQVPQRFKHRWTLRSRPQLRLEEDSLVLHLPSPVQARVPLRSKPDGQPDGQRADHETGQWAYQPLPREPAAPSARRQVPPRIRQPVPSPATPPAPRQAGRPAPAQMPSQVPLPVRVPGSALRTPPLASGPAQPAPPVRPVPTAPPHPRQGLRHPSKAERTAR